jgi:hypothetical protein
MDLALPSKDQRPSKRGRHAQHEQGDLSLEEVARLSAATSSSLKVLKSAVMRTFLAPNESKYILAAKLAGKQYNERQQKKTAGEPFHAFIVVGHALLKTLATDTDANPADRAMAESLMSGITEFSDLYSVFRVCHMVKCHDGLQSRIEFAMNQEYAKLANALGRAIVQSAAKQECFGPAPRMPLDRSIGAALSKMKI